MRWRCQDLAFDLTRRTLVMGVVNVTPDSFSDGGRTLDPARAVEHALRLIEEGAALVDLGAESTRPGAVPVPAAEQLRRVMPVIETLAQRSGVCLSIDTSCAEVARQALAAGVRVVNDVTALGDPDMASVVAEASAGLVLMHMRGRPDTMQHEPRYEDAPREVREFLGGRLAQARRAGIRSECVTLDPGIGFGKTVRHNLELLARLDELLAVGRPVMIGVSRKSFLGQLLDAPVDRRLEGALAATAVAVFRGARIVRTHDVAATTRAVRVAEALRESVEALEEWQS